MLFFGLLDKGVFLQLVLLQISPSLQTVNLLVFKNIILKRCKLKAKAVPLHTTKALVGRGGVALTHS
jgi:hypothetical protein